MKETIKMRSEINKAKNRKTIRKKGNQELIF